MRIFQFIATAVFLLGGCDHPPAANTAASKRKAGFYKVGDTLRDFTLRNVKGFDVNIHDLQGKVLLINFFASW